MGRSRLPQNEHLPPGITFRRGRYLVTYRDNGERRQVAGGATLEQARKVQCGFGHITRAKQHTMPPGFAAALWKRAQTNARTKGVPFTITREDVARMIEAADGRCPLAGIAFDYAPVAQRFRPWAPSLDRLVPALGYTRDNCRVVCAYINLAQNEFGEETLLAVARALLRQRRVELRARRDTCGLDATGGDAIIPCESMRRVGRVVEGA